MKKLLLSVALALLSAFMALPSQASTEMDRDIQVVGNLEIWTLTPKASVTNGDSAIWNYSNSPPWVQSGNGNSPVVAFVAYAPFTLTMRLHFSGNESMVIAEKRQTNVTIGIQPPATPSVVTALGQRCRITIVNGTGGTRTAAEMTTKIMFMRPGYWW